ncbi:MAG TPA: Fur family transcriptional regulator [Candidatus Saccharimonadales bacterium]|nr:Fur family transcriptional regulator [Candidatus Saccharimonadales bacterium]
MTQNKQNELSTVDEITFEEILDKKRLRVTRERRNLYERLAGQNRPVSINQLVSSLSTQMDPATVYRNVELFEKIGIINKVYAGWKYRVELSERFRPHHHHLSCQNCGKIIPITLGVRLEKAIESFGRKHGFKITDHEVELRGLCKNCN